MKREGPELESGLGQALPEEPGVLVQLVAERRGSGEGDRTGVGLASRRSDGTAIQ